MQIVFSFEKEFENKNDVLQCVEKCTHATNKNTFAAKKI